MKECKDFGEVLVALGQGKTIIDKHLDIYRLSSGYKVLDFRDISGNWHYNFSPLDAIELPASIYEEPKMVEIDTWLNVYPWGASALGFHTREMADKGASPERTACLNIKRTVTEGEGLDE